MTSTLFRQILIPVLLIAFTDISLQLDNAIAISTVASQVPTRYRLFVLAGGVLLAAVSLLAFTLVGSFLVQRLSCSSRSLAWCLCSSG
jgi:predicted tellurium resistance membrane protein TerC